MNPRHLIVCLIVILVSPSARADIYRWDNGQVIPGTEGIEPGPGVQLDHRELEYAGLHGIDLTEANFSHSNLRNAQLSSSTLSNANLTDANLTNANLGRSDLTSANLSGAEIRGTHWCGAMGFSSEHLYSTQSYRERNLTGISFGRDGSIECPGGLDLTGWDVSGQNLTHANLFNVTVTNTNFAGALVSGAAFGPQHFGFTMDQLYSTASYQQKQLSGIVLSSFDFNGWDFSGQDLTNAIFSGRLAGATLSFADLRNASSSLVDLADATSHNAILSDGTVAELSLTAGERLVVHRYKGDPDLSIPISVQHRMTMSGGGTLQLHFDADSWNSEINFEPGIPVQLGGTLELTFVDDVDVATQIGRTIRVFDWAGVEPTGAFTVSSFYPWDVSQLYTTGEVTLLLPGDTNGDQTVNIEDLNNVRNNFGLSGVGILGDNNNDQIVDIADLNNVRNFFGTRASRPVPDRRLHCCCFLEAYVCCSRRFVGEPGAHRHRLRPSPTCAQPSLIGLYDIRWSFWGFC